MDNLQRLINLAATTPVTTWLIPLFFVTITYYQGAQYLPQSRPINVSVKKLLNSYDFIIVGGGSAGI